MRGIERERERKNKNKTKIDRNGQKTQRMILHREEVERRGDRKRERERERRIETDRDRGGDQSCLWLKSDRRRLHGKRLSKQPRRLKLPGRC